MMIMNGMVILDEEEVNIIEGFAQEKIPTREMMAYASWLEFKSRELHGPVPMNTVGEEGSPAIRRMAGDMLIEWRNMLPMPRRMSGRRVFL